MGAFISWMRSVTTTLKEALAALADAFRAPSEGNPFRLVSLWTWSMSSLPDQRRHPSAEIDRVYRKHLAKLGKRRRDPAAQETMDCREADTVQHPPPAVWAAWHPNGVYS